MIKPGQGCIIFRCYGGGERVYVQKIQMTNFHHYFLKVITKPQTKRGLWLWGVTTQKLKA